MTSHNVVARVRRLAGTRKVGHAGTLDPMATGVLVVGVNRATRLLGHLMLADKSYDATIRLGVATTTDDAEGEVVATADTAGLDEAAVDARADGVRRRHRAGAVRGVRDQGRRPACVRTGAGRRGGRAARASRDGARAGAGTVADGRGRDRARRRCCDCSSGTYIRALARDLGAELGVGGHLTALRRTAVGSFDLAVAHTLEELGERFVLLPIADAARGSFTSLDLDETMAQDVRHGRKLELDLAGTTAVFAPDGEFLALYEPTDTPGLARATAVFTG